MATTGTLKSLSRLGYVRSIADQYEEQAPGVSKNLQAMLDALKSHCDAAMHCWEENLTRKDFKRISAMLMAIGNQTPLGRENDISTYTAFGLCLLEDMPKLKPDKAKAVDRVKRSLLDVHNHFTKNGEVYEWLKEGATGADAWDQAQI
jgi:hypothetical protein